MCNLTYERKRLHDVNLKALTLKNEFRANLLRKWGINTSNEIFSIQQQTPRWFLRTYFLDWASIIFSIKRQLDIGKILESGFEDCISKLTHFHMFLNYLYSLKLHAWADIRLLHWMQALCPFMTLFCWIYYVLSVHWLKFEVLYEFKFMKLRYLNHMESTTCAPCSTTTEATS